MASRGTRRSCMFCGLTRQLSKEHAWPQWLGAGAEVTTTHQTHVSGFTRTGESEFTELPNIVADRPRSVLMMQLREVCLECNTGWMSTLETRVKPLLKRLWEPSAFGVMSLGPAETATLARWAAKTAWVLDRSNSADFLVDSATRRQLLELESPPASTKVWAAQHRGVQNFQSYATRVSAGHRDDAWDADRRRLILLNSLTFRGLTLLVRWDDGEGAPPMVLPTHQWTQLWPRAEPMQWPPLASISDLDARDSVSRLSGFSLGDDSTFANAEAGWRSVPARVLFDQ